MPESKIDSIISDLILVEGGFSDDPSDKGGRTNFGISERSNPEAWIDGLVTEQEARDIFKKKYVETPKFNLIKDPKVQSFLVDWGVHSGPQLAIMELQKLLLVEADGILGPKTFAALESTDQTKLLTHLVIARLKMFGRIFKKDPTQTKFAVGWITRATDWLL